MVEDVLHGVLNSYIGDPLLSCPCSPSSMTLLVVYFCYHNIISCVRLRLCDQDNLTVLAAGK